MIKTKEKLYFAYGSNMNLNQMAFRCPDAEVVESVRLEGYRLAFRTNGGGNGVATILPEEGSYVDGVLWRISERDEQHLDHYEGFPFLYGKEPVTVTNQDGVRREIMAYMAFLSIHNKLLDNKDFILKAMLNQLLELQTKVISTKADIVEINEKISELVTQNHSLARLQTKGCIDSAIFIERSNRNNQKIEELRRELHQRQEPDGISNAIEGTQLLLDLLESAKPMLKLEPAIFQSMVKQITVYQETFCFQLANGMILEERRTQS